MVCIRDLLSSPFHFTSIFCSLCLSLVCFCFVIVRSRVALSLPVYPGHLIGEIYRIYFKRLCPFLLTFIEQRYTKQPITEASPVMYNYFNSFLNKNLKQGLYLLLLFSLFCSPVSRQFTQKEEKKKKKKERGIEVPLSFIFPS